MIVKTHNFFIRLRVISQTTGKRKCGVAIYSFLLKDALVQLITAPSLSFNIVTFIS